MVKSLTKFERQTARAGSQVKSRVRERAYFSASNN